MKIKKQTDKQKFVMKLHPIFRWTGTIFTIVVMVVYILEYGEKITLTSVLLLCVPLASIGILLMLGTFTWFWSISIDGDDILVTKFLLGKKQYKFSEISRCEYKYGGRTWSVVGFEMYVKTLSEKEEFFYVDAFWDGVDLFEARILEMGIPMSSRLSEKYG